jgi:trans-aconitate 2-methyltransferase
MNNVNYAAMSDRELKRYILTHRDDREAFYAYMDRRRSRPRQVTIKLDDPAWEEKIISAIRKINMERIKDMSLVELLNPQQHEDILDLGCGNGIITTKIADSAARVVGIDICDSREDSCNNFQFERRNATDLDFNPEFDAVFSNLVIHHIKTPEQVISSVWNALRPGGRFVAEFYGHGTAKEIILALQEVMSSQNYSFDINEDFPWYLPTQEEYCNLLTSQGFTVIVNKIFPKKLDLHKGVDICRWLEQIPFNTEKFNHINDYFEEVQKKVRCQLFEDSQWFVNYQHIRIVARKSE